MAMRRVALQIVRAGASIIIARQNQVLQAIVARRLEDVVVEELLIECSLGAGVLGVQRSPNPLACDRQVIRRVAAARGEQGKYRAFRIGKDALLTPHRITSVAGQQLGPMSQCRFLDAVDIAGGQESQPR